MIYKITFNFGSNNVITAVDTEQKIDQIKTYLQQKGFENSLNTGKHYINLAQVHYMAIAEAKDYDE
jgi:hypothetical protein